VKSAKLYIETAKETKKLLPPLMWFGIAAAFVVPVLAIFNWTWGAIFASSSALAFLARRFLAGRIDWFFQMAEKAQEAEDQAVIDEHEEALREVERERQRKIDDQKAAEKKAKEDAAWQANLARDPYYYVDRPAKLVLAVMTILYRCGVAVYSTNIYQKTDVTRINKNLAVFGMILDTVTSKYVRVRLNREGDEYLFLILPRIKTGDSIYDDLGLTIQDQFGNELYKNSAFQFYQEYKEYIKTIINNWSDDVLTENSVGILRSIALTHEDSLASRMEAPGLEETLEEVMREGLNG